MAHAVKCFPKPTKEKCVSPTPLSPGPTVEIYGLHSPFPQTWISEFKSQSHQKKKKSWWWYHSVIQPKWTSCHSKEMTMDRFSQKRFCHVCSSAFEKRCCYTELPQECWSRWEAGGGWSRNLPGSRGPLRLTFHLHGFWILGLNQPRIENIQ
jgi:hypothetical protein